MYILAFAIGANGLNNYISALRLGRDQGNRCEIVCLDDAEKPFHCGYENLGIPCRNILGKSNGSPAENLQHRIAALIEFVVSSDPDIFFISDSQSALGIAVADLLRQSGFKGVLIDGQNQLSESRVSRLHVDRMFCFGERQIRRSRSAHQLYYHAVGLPRLDEIKGLPSSRLAYGVFLARIYPEVPVVNATLAAFEKHCGMPIVVCNDPSALESHTYKSGLVVPRLPDANGRVSILQYLQHCSFVLATDSTWILEAMYLGKPVVLLPNAGLGALDHYPGVASGFGSVAIAEAFKRVLQSSNELTEFIEDVVGGIRYDHTQRVLTAWNRLAVSGPLRAVNQSGKSETNIVISSEAMPKLDTRVELLRLVPDNGQVAELGVAKGSFSDELLRARKDIHLFSVDRWGGDRGHDDVEFSEAKSILSKHGSRNTIVRKSFECALPEFEQESLDLVYIDGYAHNGQEEGRTLNQWWEKVKPGGVLAGHDYHPDWKQTVAAVDNFRNQHQLKMLTTNADFFPSWYMRKPLTAKPN